MRSESGLYALKVTLRWPVRSDGGLYTQKAIVRLFGSGDARHRGHRAAGLLNSPLIKDRAAGSINPPLTKSGAAALINLPLVKDQAAVLITPSPRRSRTD